MSDKTCNYFESLNKINVSGHVEKKGGFSYLSWPYAVAELRKHHPDATWEVKRFNNLPYMQTPMGYFVEVEVIVNGIAMSQIHPVLDNRNQVIKEPSVFHINTSIQRCLVKAIALHGLGLYIYAGEDLPMDEDVQETNKKPPVSVQNNKTNQPTPRKESYVKQAVEAFIEQEKKEHALSAEHEGSRMVSDAELRELFGDDLEIVDETPTITEQQVKRLKAKCKDTGATQVEHYGSLYKMIRDNTGIQINRSADFESVRVSDFDKLCKFLDAKKDHFKVA